MGPSHREPDAFTGPVGRNQSRSVWSRTCCSTLLSAGTIKTATHTHTQINLTKVIYNETHKHRLLTCCTQTVAMVGSLEKQDFR